MFSRLSGSWRLPLWNVFIFRSVAKSSACYCTCLTGGTRSLQPRAPLHRSPGKHPSECGAVWPGLVELSEVLRGGAGAVADSPVTARPALSWPGRRQPAHAQLCTTLRSHAGPSLGPRSSVPAPLPLWSCLETPAALDFSGRPALPFPFSEHPSPCRVSASGCAAWGPSAQRCLGLSQSPLRYPRLRGWVPSCLMSRA